MKSLLIALMFLLLTACTKEEARVVPIPTPVTSATPIPPAVVPAAVSTEKKVCHDITVNGQTKSQCKVIKTHNKYEGTVVPAQVKK